LWPASHCLKFHQHHHSPPRRLCRNATGASPTVSNRVSESPLSFSRERRNNLAHPRCILTIADESDHYRRLCVGTGDWLLFLVIGFYFCGLVSCRLMTMLLCVGWDEGSSEG
ncbi:hypothetical protein V8G54_019855, partial [Vigna mungo]